MLFPEKHIHPGNFRPRAVLLPLCLLVPALLFSQPLLRKALFLGNSYTYANNLPGLVASLARASGDSLFSVSHSPGSYTLGWRPTAHVADTISLALVSQPGWNFVILQEQSQVPAIGRLRDSCMYPASRILYDSVKSANPCSRVLFYLTWGRRFGGIQCFLPNYCSPDFADFNQMQDSVTRAYKSIADSLAAWIAPVGESWRLVINGTGMVLHDVDDSHPNLKGSYLGACVFYDVMFGKPSAGNTFSAGLTPDTAALLQHAADSVTFGYAAHWNLNNDVPVAEFVPTISTDTLYTNNLSTGAGNWSWDFGDGSTSTLFEPVHIYSSTGAYSIKLRACNGCFCDSATRHVSICTAGVVRAIGGNQPVRMIGPDDSGNILFLNYPGNGTLYLYSAGGEWLDTCPVSSGKTKTAAICNGLLLWKLAGSDHKEVAGGKTMR